MPHSPSPEIVVTAFGHGTNATFTVSCPAGNGQVTVWPHGMAVYVSQPQRPVVVEGTDYFAALFRKHGEQHVRVHDDVVTDEQEALARAVLDAFDNHPDTPERLSQAREVHVAEELRQVEKTQDLISEARAALNAVEISLFELQTRLYDALDDPAAAVESAQDVLYRHRIRSLRLT